MANVFLSGPYDYKGRGWGYAHYSYGFALDSFRKVVEQEDNIVRTLQHPFNVSSARALARGVPKPVHISFLPPDVALIMPGAFNICVFAWEFDKLPKRSAEVNGIFKKDYVEALRKFDAVITLSSYAQNTLESYGIKSFVLPSATTLPLDTSAQNIDNLACYPLTTIKGFYRNDGITKTLKEIFDASPYEKRFLYILNPHDIRKNFGNLVTAFSRFVEDNPDAVLLLKMTAREDLSNLQRTAFAREFPSFENTMFNNVYFIPERLSEQDLQLLVESCETYVSPSRAEGQNLPLCEAMYSGRVTIAPDHTSMKDFVSSESNIILESNPWMIDETTHKYSEFWGLSWFNVSEESILNALNAKMNLTKEEKQSIIKRARKNIEKFSSTDAVLEKWKLIKEQLDI